MADEPVTEQVTGETTQTEVTTETTNQTTEQTPTTETTQTEQQTQAQEPAEDWRDKEIRRKHAKLKDAEREMERIRKENEDLRALAEARAAARAEGTEPPPAPKTEPRQNISQEEIQRQARALRDQERYQEQLNSTNSAGETTYGEKWGKALDKLSTFGQMDPADMTAILNTDAPAKVLFELGSNPAEYQRLMDLPPAKRLTEIVKISMKQEPKPAPNISKAPPPTESVGNRANADNNMRDSMSDEDWYAIRQKQRRERFEQQRALGKA